MNSMAKTNGASGNSSLPPGMDGPSTLHGSKTPSPDHKARSPVNKTPRPVSSQDTQTSDPSFDSQESKLSSSACSPELSKASSPFDLNEHTDFDKVFSFDSSQVPTETLISKKDRGDTGALSDAFNTMYSLLLDNQSRFNAYMSYNDNRVRCLNKKITKVGDKINEIDVSLKDHNEAIAKLYKGTAPLSDFIALKNEFA